MPPERPRRLGRGLEALIGNAHGATSPSPLLSGEQSDLRRIPLARIRPNPLQPRREFPESELAELRASLQASGLLQPIVVRQNGSEFEIVSGERRFRAASQLGWPDIQALVRVVDSRAMLTLALIENLQRADLNAIEEARGFERLHEEFTLTHQQIADAVSKERSTVTNLLRLLALPADVQHLLEREAISMGHAKALLGLPDQKATSQLASMIVAQQLSVRETERRVRALSTPAKRPPIARPTTQTNAAGDQSAISPTVRQIEDRLRKHLQTDVRLQANQDGKGTIQISFYSNDDMARILELLLGQAQIGD